MRASKPRFWLYRLNVLLTVLLAGMLWYMLNYLSSRYPFRTHVGAWSFSELSPKSKALLNDLEDPVKLVLFLSQSDKRFEHVENMLEEFDTASPLVELEVVDPDRKLGRAKELTALYELTEPSVLIMEAPQRHLLLPIETLFYEQQVDDAFGSTKRIAEFSALERQVSSSLFNLSRNDTHHIYFVTGHGERDIESMSPVKGLSFIREELRREGFTVHSFSFSEYDDIPADCDVLVVAAPTRRYTAGEANMLFDFVRQRGRSLFMLEPGVQSGLELRLLEWGIRVLEGVVVDKSQTLSGKELFVRNYGDHPITAPVTNLASVFYLPRPIQFTQEVYSEDSDINLQTPSIIPLLFSSTNGWAEMNLFSAPPIFDAEEDLKGPVSFAVAVERGGKSSIEMSLQANRLVVFGDADFITNGSIAGANTDLFINSINWLLDRDQLLDIPPRRLDTVKILLDQDQLQRLLLYTVFGIPGIFGLVGLFIALRRNK